MAGAGQPWFMPLTFPVGHVSSAIMKPHDEKVAAPSAAADLNLIGHATSVVAATRSFAMALLCIFVISEEYPAFGPAAKFEFSWMWPLLARNILGTWLIAGLWDWFLYFGPLKDKLSKYKINPKYPSNAQIRHDAFVTTFASVCGTALEIGMCHLWASGKIPYQRDMMETPLSNLIWAVTVTHWRIPHFWAIHRGMHPWFEKGAQRRLPDVGRFLYKHVHSLHHKSYNPTAFAGTNMHPVEATGYYAAALICVPFGCHPAIFLACVIDCAVGAWLGHDGFQWPGSGDYFHQLHHAYFECNYGAMHIPIDKWLGTFATGKSKKAARMEEKIEVHISAEDEKKGN